MGRDYVCNKCGYKWASRKGQDAPAYCPRCASKRIEPDDFKSSLSSKAPVELTKCDYCGKKVKPNEITGECQWKGFLGGPCLNDSPLFGIFKKKQLCKKCADECRFCEKIFCPEHIESHKC